MQGFEKRLPRTAIRVFGLVPKKTVVVLRGQNRGKSRVERLWHLDCICTTGEQGNLDVSRWQQSSLNQLVGPVLLRLAPEQSLASNPQCPKPVNGAASLRTHELQSILPNIVN